MTIICTRTPAGLDAGEAAHFEALAAHKREAAAQVGGNPQWAAQQCAEAAGLDALAAALRDPAARDVARASRGSWWGDRAAR